MLSLTVSPVVFLPPPVLRPSASKSLDSWRLTLIVCGRLPSTEYLKAKGGHHLPLRVRCWGNGTVPTLKLQRAKRDYGIGTTLDCARKRRYPEYSWISSIVDAPIVVITVTLRGSCNGKGVCSIRVRPN